MKFKSAVFGVALTLASALALAPRGHAQAGPSDPQIVGIVLGCRRH